MNNRLLPCFLCAALPGLLTVGPGAALANEDLAKQLANPISSLISVPIQMDYDARFGAARDGHSFSATAQPVIPMSLNADWNVISRTIVSLTDHKDVVPGTSQSGLSDIVQSFFFSPKKPTAGGLIWGVGPVFLLPTASDEPLGGEKWGLGPTGVVLTQRGPWTIGALANHIWSVAGTDTRQDISASFVQPFLAYTTPTAWTYALTSESTYDWTNKQWVVPINAYATKVVKVGGQALSVGGGVRYWADGPEGGPHSWGLRLIVTFLFPK